MTATARRRLRPDRASSFLLIEQEIVDSTSETLIVLLVWCGFFLLLHSLPPLVLQKELTHLEFRSHIHPSSVNLALMEFIGYSRCENLVGVIDEDQEEK